MLSEAFFVYNTQAIKNPTKTPMTKASWTAWSNCFRLTLIIPSSSIFIVGVIDIEPSEGAVLVHFFPQQVHQDVRSGHARKVCSLIQQFQVIFGNSHFEPLVLYVAQLGVLLLSTVIPTM